MRALLKCVLIADQSDCKFNAFYIILITEVLNKTKLCIEEKRRFKIWKCYTSKQRNGKVIPSDAKQISNEGKETKAEKSRDNKSVNIHISF